MRITVGKATLLKELGIVQGVVEKKNTIPILSNLLLEAHQGTISIKGTDLDVSIATICDAEVREEGAVCIQAKKLFEIVKALPEAEIELKCDAQSQVSIVCERSRFKLLGLARDNFPEVQDFKGEWVSLPAYLLRIFIARTLFAVTQEESRYALNGAKFELSGDMVRMVATDGHRLSFIERRGQIVGGATVDSIIPKKTLAELAKLCAETEETVEFGKDENHLFFKVGKRLLVSRTLSGQFPNYELVLPKNNKNKVVFDSGQLASAVRRVALMADERSHAVKFEIGRDQVVITSQSADVGEAGETLPVEYGGEAISIGFNAQYLQDFFSVIQGGEVAFEFKDGNSQVQIRPLVSEEYDFRYIVMPMRL